MFPIRVKVCSESDLRMLGDLARNIQRVLPVTQADIDAAAALGKGWVVWKVIEVNDPIDNLRGGTQLVIKQNSITPGQNVRRVLIVSGPGGETVVIGPGPSPLLLPDAIADSLTYVKAFGGTEQNGTPTPDYPMDIVSNNGVIKVFSGNKFTTDGEATGYIIGSNTGEINQNANYNVSDYIYLLAGDYTGTFFDDGTGNRYFRCWSYNIDDGTPIQAIFNVQTTSGLTTFNFSVSENCYVRASYRNNFTQMTISPTQPIIYADGTVETINAHGKNLIDESALVKVSATIWRYYSTTSQGGFNLKANTTYTLSADNPNINVYFYDYETKTSIASGKSFKTYTPTEDVTVYFTLYLSAGIPDDTHIQLEIGDTATDYEPYYDGGTATAEMLLKVGNYQDVQEILSGNITRKVGVKVFDGVSTGAKATAVNVNQGKYYAVCGGQTNITATTTDLLSTHFKAGAFASGYDVFYTIATNIVLVSSDQSLTTVDSYNQWLADQYANNTPVIVIYPLATPTTEAVTGQTLQVAQGDNVLEITQASLNGLELEAEYEQGVQASVQEIEP